VNLLFIISIFAMQTAAAGTFDDIAEIQPILQAHAVSQSEGGALSDGFRISPSCGTRIFDEVMGPAMRQGMSCLAQQDTDLSREHLRRIREVLSHTNPVRMECNAGIELRARANTGENGGPSSIQISERMTSEALSGQNVANNQATIFHEMFHLLNADYVHGYVRNLPDMTIACQLCCFPNSDSGSVNPIALGAAGIAEQCRACTDRNFVASLAYWRRLLLASSPKTEFIADGFINALANSTSNASEQIRQLTAPEFVYICRHLEHLASALERLEPATRSTIKQSCRPRSKNAAPEPNADVSPADK
jgi:hypothetical protein